MRVVSEEYMLISKEELKEMLSYLKEIKPYVEYVIEDSKSTPLQYGMYTGLKEKLEYIEKSVDEEYTYIKKYNFKHSLNMNSGKYSREEREYFLIIYIQCEKKLRYSHRFLKEKLGKNAPGYETLRNLVIKATECGYLEELEVALNHG